jgi:hypothetical protein
LADSSSVDVTPPEDGAAAGGSSSGSKVSVKDLIPSKDIENVHPETTLERISRQVTRLWGDFIRVAVASLISLIGFGFLLYVFLSDNPKFEKFRDQAWPVVLTMIGGAGGYMFAKKD